MTTEFTFSSAIRGFHVYRHSWIPHVGEQLETEGEPNNTEDRFAVAVINSACSGCTSARRTQYIVHARVYLLRPLSLYEYN